MLKIIQGIAFAVVVGVCCIREMSKNKLFILCLDFLFIGKEGQFNGNDFSFFLFLIEESIE